MFKNLINKMNYIIKGQFLDKTGGEFWINEDNKTDSLKRTIIKNSATRYNNKKEAAEIKNDILNNNIHRNISLIVHQV